MWLALRLILFALGFGIRQIRFRTDTNVIGRTGEWRYSVFIAKNKRGICGFKIGMGRRSPAWIRFHLESGIDRYFKRLGISNEIETGDARFDNRVYVTCDHPFVAQVLQRHPDLRAAIATAFGRGYDRVVFDGRMIWMQRASTTAPSEKDIGMLAAIQAASKPLEAELPSRFGDPFFWKALVVEGIIWGIAGYGLGRVLEWLMHREDYHVSPERLVLMGSIAAVLMFAGLFALILLWLRRSSRSHRILVETAVLLATGLPLAGMQLVSEINRGLDREPDRLFSRQIERTESRTHGGKHPRTSYHLLLGEKSEPSDPTLPGEIEVTYAIYDAARSSRTADFALGPGFLGLEWYRTIRVGTVTWSPP